MAKVELVPGVYWVGAVDWKLSNFHGYLTQRGSTYNSYLIIDEKVVLVDTVKHYCYDEMLRNIGEIIDPARIDYVVANHVEMDHSGSLPKILEVAKKAVVITSPNGEKGLTRHYGKGWNYKVVKTGDAVKIGKRTLQFVLAPMVHWPDSMVTYIPEEKLLLSNDAFGQHLASSERFDDECVPGIVMHEAAKYYANIVLPLGAQVKKVLEAASKLDIRMIAPSHGLIWRKDVAGIVSKYADWADNTCEEKAVIVYDSMWGSTERMAGALAEVFREKGISYRLKSLQANHISDVMTDVLSAKYICVGSPTLNNGVLPTVASFLTYLKGLAPKKRIGIAFGSYGWGGQSVSDIEAVFESAGFTIPAKGLKIQYVPDDKDIAGFKDAVNQAI